MLMNVPVMLHTTALSQIMKFVKTRMVLTHVYARLVFMVNIAWVSLHVYYLYACLFERLQSYFDRHRWMSTEHESLLAALHQYWRIFWMLLWNWIHPGCYRQFYLPWLAYRMAGNFRGRKPSRISWFYSHPWKFSPRHFRHTTSIMQSV